nr:SpoIIE family protein phosphatase [Olsenella intestinalis]
MAGDISEYLDSIEALTQERLQVSVELDVARRIQLGIVPGHFELERPCLEVAALSRPAREVGGDFYAVVRLDGDRVAVAVGDASGKGMAVALFMVMVKTLIKEGLAAGDSPATVLNEVNDHICESNPEGMFVTVFACVIDPATGTVTFANAGHTTPLVVGDDARPLKQEIGTLLGLFDDIDLVDETVTLAPGETLLVFTDGVTEAVDKNKAFLGDAAFAERLSARAPFASAQSVVDATTQIVDAHAAGHEQFDDLTALALTHTPPTPAEKSLPVAGAHEVPADITSMDAVKEAIFATSADGPLKRRTTLAVEEAFANVVSYSGAKHAWYAVEEMPSGLSVTLVDDGDPFDLTTAEAPDPEFEDLEFGGMGMRLVRDLASDVSYRYEDGLNVLTIEVFD